MLRCALLMPLLCTLLACDRRAQVGEVPTEREANEILDILYQAGLADAQKQRARNGREVAWVVSAPREQLSAAIQVLNDHGLPAPPTHGMGDLLNDSGLIPSPADEHVRLEYGKAGELEQLIENLDGVVAANVELALPPPASSTRGPAAASTCAVTIRYLQREGDADLTQRAAEIRQLAAHSVPGLSEAGVTIVFSQTVPRAISPPAQRAPQTVATWASPRRIIYLLGGSSILLGCAMILLLSREVIRRRNAPRGLPIAA